MISVPPLDRFSQITSFIFVDQVLTKDSMSITVDAVVFARVTKLTRAVMFLSDPYHAARLRAATTLRKFVGRKSMYELLTDRRLLNVDMQVQSTFNDRTELQ